MLFALALLVVAPAQTSTVSNSALEDCSAVAMQGPIVEYECKDRNIQRKEARMESLYSSAIDQVEKRAEETSKTFPDGRRSHVYLEWSQSAWKQFVDAHCTVVGGLMDGSNAWVSRYAADCYSDELDRRMKFLEAVVAGDYQGK